MNKILLYTDNHFCTYSSIVRSRGERYSVRLENQLKTMDWLVDLAKQNQCSSMFCLGDFFDKPELTAEEISALSEINFENILPYFIVGNHELGTGDCEFSSAHAFLQNKECEVFNKPSVLAIGKTLIYILPYQVDRLSSVMNYFSSTIPIDQYAHKILLMHNDIKGIQMGKFKSEEGFEISDLQNNFDLVINGHIHNQMWITDNVLNLGNITGQNFSEDGFRYQHQAMILDCDTLEYSLVRNPRALNFYKIDWSQGTDIDTINKVSSMMCNAVVSMKVTESESEYLRYRFDPTYQNERLEQCHAPRNCNIVQARISVEHTVDSDSVDKVADLHLDHLQEFQNFVIQNIQSDDIVLSELQEVLK